MTRRRRRYRAPATRTATFAPALVLPLWGWSWLHEPLHLAGLAVMVLLALLVVPAVLVLAFFLPTAWTAVVPARWRKRYRQRKIARGIPRERQRSAYIPRFLRLLIFTTDRWRCAHCGIREGLQVDHVFPWSLGGLTVFFNLVTLCGNCNKIKSNRWRTRGGYVFYRPFAGADNPDIADAILRAELRHRWSPFRLLRAAWALG